MGYNFNHADISSRLSKCRPQKLQFQTFDTSLYSPKHPNDASLLEIERMSRKGALVFDLVRAKMRVCINV